MNFTRIQCIFLLWQFCWLPCWLSAQVCGLEDTLWIAPNATHTFPIQIAGVFNNNLADPAQGICAVEIEFVHQFVENLELWLTAPNGTTIQLIGPNTDDPTAFTFFARWDISFVRCAAPAMPDLGYATQWNNNQALNFVSGGRYIGSYYPYSGCLENFNSGPVNGTWTITVVNDPSPFYGGAILDFRLVFCDERGIDCCLADPGEWPNPPNLTTCRGADTLSRLRPLPFYPGRRPDSTLFASTYVIALNDTIVAYSSNLNLQQRPAGTYTVCGLSYERADSTRLPSLATPITLDSLRRDLQGLTPSFCGELTTTCASIRILAPPDTTRITRQICQGDTAYIGTFPYTATGTYLRTLRGAGGCDSIVQLNLTVHPLSVTSLSETICQGDTIYIGSTYYTQPGNYAQVLAASTGCDSTVLLNLTVFPNYNITIDTSICVGDTIWTGGNPYWQSGIYTIPLTSAQGCDSIVTLRLEVVNLQAHVAVPDTLTCARPQVVLDASASTPAGNLRFLWRNAQGDSIGNSPTLGVLNAGWYRLEISPLVGPACLIADSVLVLENRQAPLADAGPDSMLTCALTALTLGGASTSTGAQLTYQWTTDTGQFSSPNGAPTITVVAAGTYILSVLDLTNGCTASDSMLLQIDTLAPVALAGTDQRLTCAEPSVLLAPVQTAPDIVYTWAGPCIAGTPTPFTAIAACQGTYILQALSLSNGCAASDSIRVSQDTLHPLPSAGQPPTLTCEMQTVALQGSATSAGNSTQIQWYGPGIIAGATGFSPVVSLPGIYRIEVTNLDNGCTGMDSVEVRIDTIAPVADPGPGGRIDCVTAAVTLGGNSSTGPSIRYDWQTFNGIILGPADGPTVLAVDGGVYLLVVRDLRNGCSDTSNTVVVVDRNPPLTRAGDDFILDCQTREALLDGAGSATGPAISYLWSGPCLLGPANQAVAMADCPGVYTLTVSNADNGCTASDTMSVLVAQATAIAVLPDTLRLSCATGTVVIDGSASVYGVYEWLYNGVPAGFTTTSPEVNAAGTYILRVNTLALNCPDADTTVVLLDCTVRAQIEPHGILTCFQNTLTLDALASSAGPEIAYEWTGPAPGCIVGGQGSRQAQVVCPGDYQLVVRNTATNVTDTARTTVLADQTPPVADAGPPDTITCAKPFGLLDGRASSTGPRYIYHWTNAAGVLLSMALLDSVTLPGGYFLEVIDTINGCNALDFITIVEQTTVPLINFGNATFPCGQDSFLLRAFIDPPSANYVLSWSGPGIRFAQTPQEVWIDATGTYTLSVRDTTSGCTSQEFVTVVQPNCGPCVRVAAPDTVTCTVTEVSLLASFCEPCPGCMVQWTTTTGAILSGDNTLTPLVRAGLYTLAVTDTAGITVLVNVQVPALNTPPAADAGPDQQIDCRQSSVVLGGAGTATGPFIRYEWQNLQGQPVVPANQLTATVALPGQYALAVRDLRTGCAATDTVQVQIDTLHPVANAGPDKLITCAMPFAIPEGDSSSLGTQFAYQWRGIPPAVVAAGDTTLNPIVTVAGRYVLQVVNTRNGCAATDTMQVALSAQLPTVPPVPDLTLTCADSVRIAALAPADTIGRAVAWCRMEAGNVAVDCTQGLSREIRTPGIYRLEVTDLATGCRNTGFFNVNRNIAPPTVDAGTAPAVLSCTNPSTTLNGAVGPAGAGLRWRWYALGGSMLSDSSALMPVVSQPDVYVLEAQRTDNGCIATDSVTVLLNDDFPIASAGPDTALTCIVQELRLQGVAQTTGASVQWSWTTPDGVILDGAQTPNPRIHAPGTYILRITDPASGCTDTDTVIVWRNQDRPMIRIDLPDGATLNCVRSTLVLNAGASRSMSGQAIRFRWFGAPGSIAGPADSARITVQSVGFYRLVLEDLSNGCRDTALVQIGGSFDPPFVNIAAPEPLTCTRTAVLLTGVVSPPGHSMTYAWVLPSGDTITSPTPAYAANRPGRYQLRVTDTRNGCTGTASVVVQQDTMRPSARIVPPDTLNCSAPQVTLDARISVGRGALTFQWLGPAGGIQAGQGTPQAVIGRPGEYLLVLADGLNGCQDTARVEVLQSAISITGLQLDIIPPSCTGLTDGLIRLAGVIGGTAPFRTSLNNSSPGTQSAYPNLAPGSYTLSVQDALGCVKDSVVVLPEAQPPLVELGPDIFIRLGDSTRLEAVVNQLATRIIWAPAEQFPAPESLIQTIRPTANETYRVTVFNAAGCQATDYVHVWVDTKGLYFVPTAFSPNGDGHNDVFVVFAGQAVQSIRWLRIFDRWGNLVFSRQDFPPNDPAYGWDGHLDGRPLNPAVFVVTAELELWGGRVERFSGELTLMR